MIMLLETLLLYNMIIVMTNMNLQSLDERHCRVPSDHYDRGIRNNVLMRFWHKYRFTGIRKILEGSRPAKILDIGCHGGTLTEVISKKFPGAKVFAIDISPDAVEYAKKQRPKINFLLADANSLPFEDNFFDLVTCSDTFEHLPDSGRVLSEIRRVLSKRGEVLFIIPTESILFKFVWFFWTKWGPGKVWQETHIHQFNGHKLDRLLERSGFKIEARKTINCGMLLLVKAQKTISS